MIKKHGVNWPSPPPSNKRRFMMLSASSTYFIIIYIHAMCIGLEPTNWSLLIVHNFMRFSALGWCLHAWEASKFDTVSEQLTNYTDFYSNVSVQFPIRGKRKLSIFLESEIHCLIPLAKTLKRLGMVRI